ncbi:pimeloyl-ACP methyl ester carboxylesterase [Streptosporangium becharense]|uniref:Pimeloyl-ACP methyl ester carboxylesterase n=1 Tax=Streptosporangium becharense TaxID=1816182 RepID=A0A7W9MJY7_9ACTN|nr:alpha/beta hydrolase [Streptosporangium becharense]MBB2914413.1 pimeloyl-ACP methyl ester carboxylesterase [Streptosporangium becharense]MBB5823555.1 pimeloyl-ACP methyl ester carboxylesterase [Streptosporangium becharense]
MTLAYDDGGAGDPVVLLHSSAADSRMWDPQWELLTAGFRVIRPDFRGYGRTPYAAERPYTDSGDVAELLAGLGLTRVALVGSSYGGRVALELATAHPALVSRLVLLNPGCGLPATPDLAAFGAEEDRLLEAGEIEAAVELNARTWLGPEAGPQARARQMEMQRHSFTVQLAADPEPSQLEGEIDLAAVTAPAVVVTGGHDLPYFRAVARHLADHLAAATLIDLDWAGHLPSMERPEEITRLLVDHLS